MTTATTQTISDEWRETTLEKCVSVLGDGLHGTPKYSERGEYHFINGNNLVDGKIKLKDDTKRTSVDEYEKYKKPLNKRTLFVSINGTLGSVGAYNNEKVFLGKSVCYFNVLEDVSTTFIKYTLTGRHFQKYISITANGTTIKNVPLSAMRAYSFNLPPLPEQKAIADVLSSFDDKIELLREQNKTLEAMAQALFKHWFVDFEFPNEDGKPYKSSGGKMVDSELGEIPDGWSVQGIRRLVIHIKDSVNPSSNPTQTYTHCSIPAFDNGEKPEVQVGLDIKSNKYLVPDNTLLVSKLNPSTPRVWAVLKSTDNTICSTEFQVIKPDRVEQMGFIWSLVNTPQYTSALAKNAHGTSSSHQRVSPDDILDTQIPMPEDDLISVFSNLTNPTLKKIYTNKVQIQTLSKTRDALLPKLMRGDVRVNFNSL